MVTQTLEVTSNPGTTSTTRAATAATTDEIERMMRNLCAYALSEPDPLLRFLDLTHQQAVFEGVAAALQRERGNALADLAEIGMPLDRIVEHGRLGSTQQLRTLVKAAGRKLPTARKGAAKKVAATKTAAKELPVAESTARGSRLLTTEERKALGLPPLKKLPTVAGKTVAGKTVAGRQRAGARSA